MLSPKEIATRWFHEVWGKRNTDVIRELLAPDATGHLEGGVDIVGPEPFIVFRQSILDAMPDLRVEVVNSLADGDDACVLCKATATHTGHGMGLVPTGKAVTFRGMTWLHIVDGRITEGWDNWNQGQLMATLASKAAV